MTKLNLTQDAQTFAPVTPNGIAQRFRGARELAGLSPEDVIDTINLLTQAATYFDNSRDPAYIHKIEDGTLVPNEQFIAALSVLYNTTPATLLGTPETVDLGYDHHIMTFKAVISKYLETNEKAVHTLGSLRSNNVRLDSRIQPDEMTNAKS